MTVYWLPNVTTSPLFIDYLSLTLNVPELEKHEVLKDFMSVLSQFPDKKEMFGNGDATIKTNDGLYYYRKDVYLLEEDEHIRFYCMPKNIYGNFLKIEWNPSKVDSAEVAEIVNLILPGGYCDLIAYGRITRVDITTLVQNVGMDKILYHYPNLKVTKSYAGPKGNGSAYLGSVSSEKSFTFYDKKKQVKDTNKKKFKMHKKPIPKTEQIQVEFKFRPKKKSITLSELFAVGKPFYEKLKIMRVNYLPKQTADFDSLVNVTISNMQTRGHNKALQLIEGPKRRKKVQARIEQVCYASWWNPEKLWGTLPDAIEQIVNPVPNKWSNIESC
jgi:hypothetical protein